MNKLILMLVFIFLSIKGIAQSYDSYELAVEDINNVEYLTLFEETIDDRIYEFKNVIEIQIYDCVFDSIKIDISRLKKLKKLLIHNSNLEYVSPNLLANNLSYLDLSGNKITTIDFTVNHKLKYLNLSSNPIDIKRLYNLDSLQILILNDCKLSRFPMGLDGLGLIELDLSSNAITRIPKNLYKCEELKKINLSRNKIENLPKNFFKIASLIEVYLNSNLLEGFSKCFQKLSEVKRIDLSDNNILNLTKSYSFKNLEKITLRGNPGFNTNQINISSKVGTVKVN